MSQQPFWYSLPIHFVERFLPFQNQRFWGSYFHQGVYYSLSSLYELLSILSIYGGKVILEQLLQLYQNVFANLVACSYLHLLNIKVTYD